MGKSNAGPAPHYILEAWAVDTRTPEPEDSEGVDAPEEGWANASGRKKIRNPNPKQYDTPGEAVADLSEFVNSLDADTQLSYDRIRIQRVVPEEAAEDAAAPSPIGAPGA